MTVKISEEELKRRKKVMEANTKIAGPDDPIYQGGICMSSVHFPEPEELLKFPCITDEDDDDFIYNADDE